MLFCVTWVTSTFITGKPFREGKKKKNTRPQVSLNKQKFCLLSGRECGQCSNAWKCPKNLLLTSVIEGNGFKKSYDGSQCKLHSLG